MVVVCSTQSAVRSKPRTITVAKQGCPRWLHILEPPDRSDKSSAGELETFKEHMDALNRRAIFHGDSHRTTPAPSRPNHMSKHGLDRV